MKKKEYLKIIEENCAYGRTHFCDGKVNMSVFAEREKLPPERSVCPYFRNGCPVALALKGSGDENEN